MDHLIFNFCELVKTQKLKAYPSVLYVFVLFLCSQLYSFTPVVKAKLEDK